MPELPEVETIVRGLSPHLSQLKIKGVKLLYPPLLRGENKSHFERLKGKKILGIRRRGKLILIDFKSGISLLFHLKMTGQLLLVSKSEPLDKHVHFILSFICRDFELRFRDARKFGFLSFFIREAEEPQELKCLGPEPLEVSFSQFLKIFSEHRARLRNLLLNQTVLAGIGNIYANEILFQAGIHPLTLSHSLEKNELWRLWMAMREILKKAIASQGSSIRDYRDPDGSQGNFQSFHKVYGKDGEPCSVCGERIIRLRIGGRSAFLCPRCQRKKIDR